MVCATSFVRVVCCRLFVGCCVGSWVWVSHWLDDLFRPSVVTKTGEPAVRWGLRCIYIYQFVVILCPMKMSIIVIYIWLNIYIERQVGIPGKSLLWSPSSCVLFRLSCRFCRRGWCPVSVGFVEIPSILYTWYIIINIKNIIVILIVALVGIELRNFENNNK